MEIPLFLSKSQKTYCLSIDRLCIIRSSNELLQNKVLLADKLIGQPITNIIPEADRLAFSNAIRDCFSTGEIKLVSSSITSGSIIEKGKIDWELILQNADDNPWIIVTGYDTCEEKTNPAIVHLLNERVKELTTLYKFGHVLENDTAPIEKIMQSLVNLMPDGWQYPDIAAAKIVAGSRIASTGNYADLPGKQTARFHTLQGTEGFLEVVYLKQEYYHSKVSFLNEEEHMIKMLCEMFRVYLNRKEEAEALKKSEANLYTIIDNTDTIYFLLDNNLNVLTCNKPAHLFAGREMNRVVKTGDHILGYFPSDRQSAIMDKLQKALEGENINYETAFPQRDDIVHWYDVRACAIASGNKENFGIMVSLLDVTNTKQLQQEIVEQKVQEQKKITRAMISAQEKERNRIGQELHDNVNQILVGAKIFLTHAGKRDEKIAEFIDYPIELINNTITEIRNLSHKQVTPLKDLDLRDMINNLLSDIDKSSNITTDFYYALPLEVNDELKLNIYRIVQEQVSNILKHADPKSVSIGLGSDDNAIYIKIKDDGKGFDIRQKRSGIGISNIINRIESFNGKVSINSAPGNGCLVDIKIPCKPATA